MTDHALMLVGRIAAQGPSPTVSQPPHWLSVAQATGAVATTIGVLIALYIAAIREPRKDAAERRHRGAQIDSLHRAEKERVAAQARKVVPSCVRTPMFGDSWWTVRIDNASNAMTTLLAVEVTALDTNGFEVTVDAGKPTTPCRSIGFSIGPYGPRYRICRRAERRGVHAHAPSESRSIAHEQCRDRLLSLRDVELFAGDDVGVQE